MPFARRSSLVILLTAPLLAASAVAQDRRPPTIDDVIDLVGASSPQISPDGRRVLYSRSEIEAWDDNERVTSVWIVGADGSNPRRFLASDKDSRPRWSPSGEYIAFLSTRDQGRGAEDDDDDADRNAGAQIWLIRSAAGEAWKLTDHPSAVRSFEWSSDDSQIFYLANEAESDEEKASVKAGNDAIFVDEGPNGQGRSRYNELWSVALNEDEHGKETRQLTTDRLLIGGFRPSPDGSALVVTYRRENTRNGRYLSEIAVLDVETGALTDLTNNRAPEGNVAWSPDGSMVSFTAPSDSEWELAENKLWLIPAGGGAATRISDEFQGAIGPYYWAPDGESIYFSGRQRGRGGAYQLDVATGAVRTITTGDWIARLDSVSQDFTNAAGVLSAPGAPGEVHVFDLTTGQATSLTHLNPQIDDLELAHMRRVSWTSQDGVAIDGLLWLPTDYQPGVRLPLLVSVHGGPAGVWTTSFRGRNHVYAGLGWAILEPNVRGSSSYGDTLLRGNMQGYRRR